MTPSQALQAPAWRDTKRGWWLLSGFFPGLVALNLVLYHATGQRLYLWLMFISVYSVIPLFDAWLGEDRANPPESIVPELEGRAWYRVVLMLFVPLQFAVTVYGAWLFAREPAGPLGAFGLLGLLLSVGGVSGLAINTAHELGHKLPGWERWLARLVLAPVAYGHFYVEHNRGHHRRVATPEDPASSRLGESFWAFLPRTMIGGLRSAWALERDRLRNRGLAAFHWRNECLQAWAMTVLFFGALTAWLGWIVLPFLLVQALYGATLLEAVNYIEHYGLLRAKDASGRYVRCAPEHSWNSNHRVSNLFLYHLQRHSDHHAHPARRYQALRHFDDAPQLPQGYAALVLLAYFPPLWFAVMDKRVLAHYGGDISLAHLHPPRRAALLRRYAR